MEPFGSLWGVLGAPWEGVASHNAPKRPLRVPNGLPRGTQGLNLVFFWHDFDRQAHNLEYL